MKPAMLLIALALVGCGDGDVYTLYRTSVLIPNARLHVATFDTADGDLYNSENCELSKTLHLAQPGVATRFWCEKGRYRK